MKKIIIILLVSSVIISSAQPPSGTTKVFGLDAGGNVSITGTVSMGGALTLNTNRNIISNSNSGSVFIGGGTSTTVGGGIRYYGSTHATKPNTVEFIITNSAIGTVTSVGLGIGVTPTGYLHLKAGTSSASTGPLKFTKGTNTATPEAGLFEYDSVQFYNTNSLAVRGAILTVRTITSGAGTLTLDKRYTHFIFTGTTTTWTLPATGGTNEVYLIKNRGSGDITLNTAAAGNDIYSTSAVNTLTITPGQAVMLINDGTYFNVE